MTVSVSGIARTVLVSAAAAALVVGSARAEGGFALGDDSSGRQAAKAATSPVRGATLLCPGPELKGVPGLDDEPVATAVAATTAPPSLLTDVEPVDTAGRVTLTRMPRGELGAPLTTRGATAAARVDAASGVQVQATESLAPGLAAAQAWLVGWGDRRGLVTAPCGEAGADFWLLAGGGAPGRQERLVLTNPGGNPVTVDVTLHGEDGPVSSPSGDGIVVPAHGRTSFLLDSISSEVESPAVHVVAQGGVVGAVVNDVWLDGTRPGGADDAVPTAPPSREQVVPAVAVSGPAILRVAVPGADEAVVQVRVLTNAGPRAVPGGGVTRVQGGAVTDIDLTKIPSGAVGIQVRADRPVVAAALVNRSKGPGQPGDFAWSSSTTALKGLAGMPLPQPQGSGEVGVMRRVAITSVGGPAKVDVVTLDAEGAATSHRISVGADATTGLDFTAQSAVWVRQVSGSGRVHAGVGSWVLATAGMLVSVSPLWDAALRTTAVGVRPAPLP
jgi:hypothetical protein